VGFYTSVYCVGVTEGRMLNYAIKTICGSSCGISRKLRLLNWNVFVVTEGSFVIIRQLLVL